VATKEIVARAQLDQSIYTMKARPSIHSAAAVAKTLSLSHWHSRMGHLNFRDLRQLVKGPLFQGVDVTDLGVEGFCEPCVMGKHHRMSFPNLPQPTDCSISSSLT
jgi:hypothetical protein